jgi:hypothetical protein
LRAGTARVEQKKALQKIQGLSIATVVWRERHDPVTQTGRIKPGNWLNVLISFAIHATFQKE